MDYGLGFKVYGISFIFKCSVFRVYSLMFRVYALLCYGFCV